MDTQEYNQGNITLCNSSQQKSRQVLGEKNINHITAGTINNKDDIKSIDISSSPPSTSINNRKRNIKSIIQNDDTTTNDNAINDNSDKQFVYSDVHNDDIQDVDTTCVPTSSSVPVSMNKRIKIESSVTVATTVVTVAAVATTTATAAATAVADPDAERDSLVYCTEYSEEIFQHLYEREQQCVPVVNYCNPDFKLTLKQYLRPSMRAILIDWLIQVHENFKLVPETLILGINIMDRFMALKKVSLSKLQLLAITSLFIAAKFEEVILPKLEKYCYMTDNAYDGKQLKDAEMFILNTLQFDISIPNHLNFIRLLNKADDYNFNYRLLSKYYLDSAITSSVFIDELPSVVAVMSMYLARIMFKIQGTTFFQDQPVTNEEEMESWNEELVSLSNGKSPLTDTLLQQKIIKLVKEIHKPSTVLKSLDLKYSSSKFNHIGTICKKWCSEITTLIDDIDEKILFL